MEKAPPTQQRTNVVFAKELHAHDGKDENDDTQDERQVTQGTHRFTHNRNEQVERRPWFGQFEYSQLNRKKKEKEKKERNESMSQPLIDLEKKHPSPQKKRRVEGK